MTYRQVTKRAVPALVYVLDRIWQVDKTDNWGEGRWEDEIANEQKSLLGTCLTKQCLSRRVGTTAVSKKITWEGTWTRSPLCLVGVSVGLCNFLGIYPCVIVLASEFGLVGWVNSQNGTVGCSLAPGPNPLSI